MSANITVNYFSNTHTRTHRNKKRRKCGHKRRVLFKIFNHLHEWTPEWTQIRSFKLLSFYFKRKRCIQFIKQSLQIYRPTLCIHIFLLVMSTGRNYTIHNDIFIIFSVYFHRLCVNCVKTSPEIDELWIEIIIVFFHSAEKKLVLETFLYTSVTTTTCSSFLAHNLLFMFGNHYFIELK